MAAQRGCDLLLRLDQDGSGAMMAVAGLRSHSIAFNAETVDDTNQDSADRWRELLANAGVKSAAIRGAVICRDQACDETIRALFFAGAIRDWQVVIPALGRVTGAFQITALEFGGVHDGELTFELALMSAGPLSFARA
jgi:TP901-1 family phage major tail protein